MNRRRPQNRRRGQSGLTSVEFAVVGLLALIVLFSLIEIARAFFTVNALEEATRRGARVAAVCQVGDAAIAQIASFTRSGGGSLVGGLGPQHFAVQYLDRDGLVIDPTAEPAHYVRVSVQFPYRMLIPGFTTNFTMGPFTSTLPAESLGVWQNGLSPC